MKIKKFYESDKIDISSDRIEEIQKQLAEFSDIMDDKSKYSIQLLSELSNYINDYRKGNDQIDDSILQLQVIKKNIDDCIDKINIIKDNLSNYNDVGRKFLYNDKF